MEINTKPVTYNRETRHVLEEIRESTRPTVLYGLTPEQAEEALKHITEPMLEGAALPMVVLMQFRWYARELSKLFRKRHGYALSFQLDLAMRKWVVLGLEPKTMQFLLCEVYRQLKLMELTYKPEPVDTPAEPVEGVPEARDEERRVEEGAGVPP